MTSPALNPDPTSDPTPDPTREPTPNHPADGPRRPRTLLAMGPDTKAALLDEQALARLGAIALLEIGRAHV